MIDAKKFSQSMSRWILRNELACGLHQLEDDRLTWRKWGSLINKIVDLLLFFHLHNLYNVIVSHVDIWMSCHEKRFSNCQESCLSVANRLIGCIKVATANRREIYLDNNQHTLCYQFVCVHFCTWYVCYVFFFRSLTCRRMEAWNYMFRSFWLARITLGNLCLEVSMGAMTMTGKFTKKSM